MKKQGRPRFDDKLIKQVRQRFPDVKTRRGLQERVYAVQASDVLKDVSGLDFLWMFNEMGVRSGMRRKLLTELGRFGDAETIKGVAIQLCKDQKHKPLSVEKCVAKLTKIRLAKEADGFLKGEQSLMPCLVLTDYPGSKWGFVHRGKIIEEPVYERTKVVAPIEGEMPDGWRSLYFLADNGTEVGGKLATLVRRANFGGRIKVISSLIDPYIALYRTRDVFCIITLEPGANHAKVKVIGEDVYNPSSKVMALYMDILPNTMRNDLRPVTTPPNDAARWEKTIPCR